MASAWFDLKSFDQSPIRRRNNDNENNKLKRSNSLDEDLKNGLLVNIDPTLTLNEIKQLIDDCFNLSSLSIYAGLKSAEAFFLVSQCDYLQFVSALELFGDRVKLRELNEKFIYYKVNVHDDRKKVFFKRMKQIAGADSHANSYLICCDYQKKLIENYLDSQGSEYINGFDSILTKVDFKNDTNSLRSLDDIDDEIQQARGYDDPNYLQLEDLDEENFNENFSNLNLTQESTYKSKFEVRPNLNFELHHKLNDQIELILTDCDLTNLNAECLINFFKINSYSSVQNAIKLKAGSDFEFQLNKNANSFVNNQMNNLFFTNSGQLTNFKSILTYYYTNNDGSQEDNIQLTYFKINDIYRSILEKVSQSNISSLALPFISINEDDFDIGLLAFLESLNQFIQRNRIKTNLQTIYISSLDKDSLNQLENYLKNGYDKSILESIIGDNKYATNNEQDYNNNRHKNIENSLDVEPKHNRNQASNYVVEEPTDNSVNCNLCNSAKSVINYTDIVSYDFFKRCKKSYYESKKKDKSKFFKCNICFILNQIIQIDFELTQIQTLCLKCAIEILIDFAKSNYCSCCLRKTSRNDATLNKYCSNHSVCAKCFSLPQTLQPNSCFFCNMVKFGDELINLTSNENMTKNHCNMGCCINYCDLQYAQLNNKSIDKLSCGHLTCCINKLSSDNKCNYCSINRLLELINFVNKMNVNKTIDFESLDLSNDEMELLTDDEDDEDDQEIVEKKTKNDQTKLIFPNTQTNNNQIEGGNLQCKILNEQLPGFDDCNGTLVLDFFVPNGTQKECHPKPGQKYNGTLKTVYLPNNEYGKNLYDLISNLFEEGKLFKLDKSKADENEFIVVFNDIDFKTSKTGGPESNGYPDEKHLDKLKHQLLSKTEE